LPLTQQRIKSEMTHFQESDAVLAAADSAHQAGQRDTALELWGMHRHLCPADPRGYISAGVSLRNSGNFDASDALLRFGLEKCKDRIALAIEYAWNAHYQGQWDEALQRWERVHDWFPKHPAGVVGIGRVLIQLGRFLEADERLTNSIATFPTDPWVAITLAELATAQENWLQALTRWNQVLAVRPDSESAIAQRGIAQWHLRQTEHMTRRPCVVADRVSDHSEDHRERTATPDLLIKYESLGENCELGLVQRHFGAEPLGLLRWTYCTVDALIGLLEHRLFGFGELENIKLIRTSWKEYMIREDRYGISFHTFSTKDIVDESAFLRKQSSRLVWLAQKLVADLTESSKRFVLKLYNPTSDFQIRKIHSLLQVYSVNNKLLCISVSPAVSEGGTAVNAGNGLALGKLSRRNPGKRWDIPFSEWRAILESTEGFWRTGR
jgi:tetratricopeptide (TPR) repeat protein